MSQVPKLALLSAVLLLSPAVARADDRLKSIADSWDDAKKTGRDWPYLDFTDENNNQRRLFMRVSDVDAVGAEWTKKKGWFSSTDQTGGVPLFVLNEIPAPPNAEAGSAVHYYQAVLSPYTATITIKNDLQGYSNQPHWYQFDAVVTRPGTALALSIPWPGAHELREKKQWVHQPRGAKAPIVTMVDGDLSQLVVLRPKEAPAAAWSPFTRLPSWPDCKKADSDTLPQSEDGGDKYVGSDAYKAVMRYFLPEEIELARASGLNVTDPDCADVGKAVDQVKQGNAAAASMYASAKRPLIRNAALRVSAESGSASDDAFTPFEYRFLSCRVWSLMVRPDRPGTRALGDARAALTAAVKDPDALKRWRAYAKKEADSYVAESAVLPGVKDVDQPWSVKIDFDGSLKALNDRTQAMLDGKDPGAAPARTHEQKKKQPPRRRTPVVSAQPTPAQDDEPSPLDKIR